MADQQPSFFQRLTKWWPVALTIAILAGVIWFDSLIKAVRETAAEIDSWYHHRSAADGALVQLARVPTQSRGPIVRYMATFENRSDDPLLVTGVIYEVEEYVAAMRAETNAVENMFADAESMKTAETYELRQPCEKGAAEPLVPPFRIKPHATGSFEITVRRDLRDANQRWCALVVSFKTNQGETNGIIPDLE